MPITLARCARAAVLALAALGPYALMPSAHADTTIVEVAPAGPMPPPIVESVRPPAPSETWHWVPGHWVWRDVHWEWRRGRWVEQEVPPTPAVIAETPPPPPAAGWVWIQGHYSWKEGGWHWVRGRWVQS